MKELTATVIGGGIAGVASAISLARAGWRTTVLERSDQLGEVGAGVALPGNGIAALRALDLDTDVIETLGQRTVMTGFRDSQGRRILQIPDDRDDVRDVITIWGMHRARLHAALRRTAGAAGVEILTGARCSDVRAGEIGGRPATVRWERHGHEERSESVLVVGADGIRSAVRGSLFPDSKPRYSGSTSWRAIIDDERTDPRLFEVWGPAAEFGYLRVSSTELYWYGYTRLGENITFANELDAVRERFAGWAEPIQELLSRTAPEQLMRHDVHHLPGGPPSYVRGRVVMVGDAAHAALPTMGQGAATALEDGASVGTLIADPVLAGVDLGTALASFDHARRPRCRAIARHARQFARIGADLGPGRRQHIRNAILRRVPVRTLVRFGGPVVGWTPTAADRQRADSL